MRNFIIITLLALCFCTYSYAEEQVPAIGRILNFHAQDTRVKTLFGETASAEGRWIFEGESIFTVANQHLKLALEDETRIVLGPSSRIRFENWNKRDSEGKRIRRIVLDFGIAWFTVSKVYSQLEPFVVETKPGVVAVRGTEFVVETGEGGHLVAVRAQVKGAAQKARKETEVHVLEGEVFFARRFANLAIKDKRVALKAGDVSLIDEERFVPFPAQKYDLAKFESYFNQAIPDIKFVMRKTDNESRAETALALRAETSSVGASGRAIASVNSAISEENLNADKPSKKEPHIYKESDRTVGRKKYLLKNRED